MSQYTIRFLAFFFRSSSPPDTMSEKSHQVNIVTAAPNANTRKNATIFPIVPSNPAVFQKRDHPKVSEKAPPEDNEELVSGEKTL